MSMGSFFGKKSKKAHGAILIDVGSGSIGGALAVFDSSEKPNIVFETREHFPVQARLNNKHLLPLMTAALNKIMDLVAKKGHAKLIDKEGRRVSLKRIVCTLSSPWHVSTTKTLHFKFEKPFVISHSFINDIMTYEGKNFISKITKENNNETFGQGEMSAISEHEVLQTFVNGYPVSYPIDKKANEFEMILFMSAFPNHIIKIFEKVCGKHFPDIYPDFNSGTGVHFHVLKELFPNEGSFIIAHISGETTDVSVIKKNIITETISFPLGRNFIARRLMNEVPGVTPEVALSMIKMNTEGASSPKLSEKLAKILSQAEEDWVELFADSMRDFSKDFFLPTKVFVLAGDDSARTFANLITKKKLPVRGANTPSILAEDVNASLFSTSIEGGVEINRDPFLAAETYYSKQKYFTESTV